jgi:hypothetical protein
MDKDLRTTYNFERKKIVRLFFADPPARPEPGLKIRATWLLAECQLNLALGP